MLESLDPKPERFPTPYQITVTAFWGVLLAFGGCAEFLITASLFSSDFLPWVLASVFGIGVLALATSLFMLIVLGVRDWIDHFRE